MTTQLVLIDVKLMFLLMQWEVCAAVHLLLLDVEFASLYGQERVCDGTDCPYRCRVCVSQRRRKSVLYDDTTSSHLCKIFISVNAGESLCNGTDFFR